MYGMNIRTKNMKYDAGRGQSVGFGASPDVIFQVFFSHKFLLTVGAMIGGLSSVQSVE